MLGKKKQFSIENWQLFAFSMYLHALFVWKIKINFQYSPLIVTIVMIAVRQREELFSGGNAVKQFQINFLTLTIYNDYVESKLVFRFIDLAVEKNSL